MRSVAVLSALLVALPALIRAIPLDNGVLGEPEMECGSDAIYVSFNTENSFEGHVYVKGHYSEEGCRVDGGGQKSASIRVPFETCGLRRERTGYTKTAVARNILAGKEKPKEPTEKDCKDEEEHENVPRSQNPPGIFVMTTIIITFHPLFMTKVDRAYEFRCFYMEADKTVSTDIEVSMITTAAVVSVGVAMPVCRYEVLRGGPTGPPVKYAVIGDHVYHKWTCDSEMVEAFCMLVHSCYVDDGAGNKVMLLNEQGCAQDRYLLQNLEYMSDLMAGREAHVFKYADRPSLYFQCQIGIMVKEENDCVRPSCPDPTRGRRSAKFARSAMAENQSSNERIRAIEVDVSSPPINILELDQDLEELSQISLLGPDDYVKVHESKICMALNVFYVAVSLLLGVCVATVAIVLCTCCRRKQIFG